MQTFKDIVTFAVLLLVIKNIGGEINGFEIFTDSRLR